MSGLPRSAHVVVTGGGRGIGRAIAAALVDAGATVTVIGRNAASLEEAIKAGAAHHATVADVSDEAALRAAIAAAHARKPIDILSRMPAAPNPRRSRNQIVRFLPA